MTEVKRKAVNRREKKTLPAPPRMDKRWKRIVVASQLLFYRDRKSVV